MEERRKKEKAHEEDERLRQNFKEKKKCYIFGRDENKVGGDLNHQNKEIRNAQRPETASRECGLKK